MHFMNFYFVVPYFPQWIGAIQAFLMIQYYNDLMVELVNGWFYERKYLHH